MEQDGLKDVPTQQAGLMPAAGTWLGLLAISLVFGNGWVTGALLLASTAGAACAAIDSPYRQRLLAWLSSQRGRTGLGLVLTALVLSGVFGNALLMVAVIGLGALWILASGETGTERSGLNLRESVHSALPAQAPSGQDKGSRAALDVRTLCQGLPPLLAGQVLVTAEQLEGALADAQEQGEAKAAYDAHRCLTDDLPDTVSAWKAQQRADQDVAELERALIQIREIVGTPDGTAQRRKWETQQRFLKARRTQS